MYSQLLIILGLIFTFVGVIIPIGIAWYQKRRYDDIDEKYNILEKVSIKRYDEQSTLLEEQKKTLDNTRDVLDRTLKLASDQKKNYDLDLDFVRSELEMRTKNYHLAILYIKQVILQSIELNKEYYIDYVVNSQLPEVFENMYKDLFDFIKEELIFIEKQLQSSKYSSHYRKFDEIYKNMISKLS